MKSRYWNFLTPRKNQKSYWEGTRGSFDPGTKNRVSRVENRLVSGKCRIFFSFSGWCPGATCMGVLNYCVVVSAAILHCGFVRDVEMYPCNLSNLLIVDGQHNIQIDFAILIPGSPIPPLSPTRMTWAGVPLVWTLGQVSGVFFCHFLGGNSGKSQEYNYVHFNSHFDHFWTECMSEIWSFFKPYLA